jgi:large subunit ribosomal protein L30
MGLIMAEKIKIRLIKSSIGRKPNHKRTIKALGLRKINSEVIHEKNAVILGMVKTVEYMVSVEEMK